MDQRLQNTHVKLLAFDLLSLAQTPSFSTYDPIIFTRKNTTISRTEILGVITSRELKPNKFLKFTIDDGTGCVTCVLWLNQLTSPYFSRRNPANVKLIADMAAHFASEIKIGVVARVRGRIAGYRGAVQVTVSDVVVERDPNVEAFHWLDCIRLARNCYNVVAGGANIMEIDAEDVKDSSLILIKQGAEARVFESSFVGRRSIVKERFSKKYRHPTLDSKLTLKRLNAEARCMTKARRLGVSTPVLYAVDPLLHSLTFEYVEGPSVKDVFLEFGLHGIVEERLDDIAMQIGDSIGKLHDGGLIHGDLTTSNMLLRMGTNQLVLIDFGLSFTSTLPEDKAVDLYVLERALLSMHSSCGNVMDRILAGYRKSSKQWSSTLNKLAQGTILLS
ncbi:hypothetical protein H0E87_011156 [Populus deltoides]|uniref:non-specific serine/threonine protein kinase n=1 Tax=Populus deltoides TaxID=3696 RepID=A0A8T2YW82_POPDE|nr:hypothetical protein H0E87_011156 [Populus deltoides]